MSFQLTDEQYKIIAEIALQWFPTRETAKAMEVVIQVITELAPAILEEGRQAGLEEAAKIVDDFRGYPPGNHPSILIRALRDKP